MLYRTGLAALAAVLCLSPVANADWSESFTGGTPDQSWDIFIEAIDGAGMDGVAWPVVNSGSVYGELRDPAGITLPDPETIETAIGVVNESFTDVTISAWVNLDPVSGNETALGLLARADLELGTAYGFGVDLADGAWGIVKFADTAEDVIAPLLSDTDNDSSTNALPTNVPLYLVFDITGNVLTGQVFDAATQGEHIDALGEVKPGRVKRVW